MRSSQWYVLGLIWTTTCFFLESWKPITISFVASLHPSYLDVRQRHSTTIRHASKNVWSIQDCLEQQESIRFLDVSWYHKGGRDGRQEFIQGPRIPGAMYWDMDDIATSLSLFPELNPQGLRVMFPPKSLIEATLHAMTIDPQGYSNTLWTKRMLIYSSCLVYP